MKYNLEEIKNYVMKLGDTQTRSFEEWVDELLRHEENPGLYSGLSHVSIFNSLAFEGQAWSLSRLTATNEDDLCFMAKHMLVFGFTSFVEENWCDYEEGDVL